MQLNTHRALFVGYAAAPVHDIQRCLLGDRTAIKQPTLSIESAELFLKVIQDIYFL